ncbi:hypothetical protein PR202_gb26595 [Eleusine coracana subsp. coracana]|uniref:SIAH-type domain-containing protein n=1 Tax=Eleusine coracana subsp. coracana TaxID=191504 RepID=A0AAV5FTN9_ELECO|nr:hypothetical protein QOZ80_1BG0056620 [Eleusine coracana subsp. coracana]GJN37621.1 hypothetical protein PR202_gb26595 [Eleusine coracana subsp. coracana]
MVEERHKRPSPQTPDEERLISKKSATPVVKLEPGVGQLIASPGSGGPRARALAAAEQTSPAAEAERARFNARFYVDLFHCDGAGCHGHLKPPVFKCEAGHLLCHSCRRDGHCRTCNGSNTFVPCPEVDRYIHGATVPCPYEAAGCDSSVPYHAVLAHGATCAFAPCPCLVPGCAFAAAPPTLRNHLAGAHSWAVHKFSAYSKVHALSVPVPTSESQHLLVVDGDAARVVLLSLRRAGAAVAVSVACVRAADAAAGPHFRCSFWTEAEAPIQVQRRVMVEMDVASCAVPGGQALDEVMCLYVPVVLLGPSGDVVLRIRIDEIRRPPISAARSASSNASSH